MYSKDVKSKLDRATRKWTDGSKYILVNHDAPVEVRENVTLVGSDDELLEWVNKFPHGVGAIYVVSESNILYDMKSVRPTLEYHYIT